MSQCESHNVNLHLLSPVHVGSGRELDPFSYVIKDENLVLIDLIKWIAGFANKEDLYGKMDSDDYVSLRAYIAQNFDDASAVLGSIPVESHEFLEAYRKAIHSKRSEHQALINFMTRNEVSGIPYIPGSSIKGAMRTALANWFVKKANVLKGDRAYNKKIFGAPTKDPMKYLKVADVVLDRFGTAVWEAKEHSAKEKPLTPKGAFEAAVSLCSANEPIVYPLYFSLAPFQLHQQTIDLPFLVEALNRFYLPKFKSEYGKFYSHSGSKSIQEAMAPLTMNVAHLKTNEALIRIGHFSHVECITLDDVRTPKTRLGKDRKPLPWGTTRTLANGLYPFGWAKLVFRNIASHSRMENNWPFSIEDVEGLVEAKRQAIEREQEAALEAEKRAKEAKAKLLAQEQRQAELASMSPEERDLSAFDDGSVTDQQVNVHYKGLDEYSGEYRPRFARRLKDYWVSKKQWTKKEVGNKQWKKVRERNAKLDKILGEE